MRCDTVGCTKEKYHWGLCTAEVASLGASNKGRPKPYDRPNVETNGNDKNVQNVKAMTNYVKMFTIYDPERGSEGYSLQDVYSLLTESCDMKMDKQLFFQSDFTSLMKEKIDAYRTVNDIESVGGPCYKPGTTGTLRFHGIKFVSPLSSQLDDVFLQYQGPTYESMGQYTDHTKTHVWGQMRNDPSFRFKVKITDRRVSNMFAEAAHSLKVCAFG